MYNAVTGHRLPVYPFRGKPNRSKGLVTCDRNPVPVLKPRAHYLVAVSIVAIKKADI